MPWIFVQSKFDSKVQSMTKQRVITVHLSKPKYLFANKIVGTLFKERKETRGAKEKQCN